MNTKTQEYQKRYYQEHKAQRRAYIKQWQKEHPDKMRMYKARYLKKKAAQMAGDLQEQEGGGNGAI